MLRKALNLPRTLRRLTDPAQRKAIATQLLKMAVSDRIHKATPPSQPPVRTTPRGFRVYHEDATLRVQESSAFAPDGSAGPPIRLYGGLDADGHIHLSFEQARHVQLALTRHLVDYEARGGYHGQ